MYYHPILYNKYTVFLFTASDAELLVTAEEEQEESWPLLKAMLENELISKLTDVTGVLKAAHTLIVSTAKGLLEGYHSDFLHSDFLHNILENFQR